MVTVVVGVGLRSTVGLSRKHWEIQLRLQLVNNRKWYAFEWNKRQWPWMTMKGQSAYTITGNQKVIRWGATFGSWQSILTVLYCAVYSCSINFFLQRDALSSEYSRSSCTACFLFLGLVAWPRPMPLAMSLALYTIHVTFSCTYYLYMELDSVISTM